MVLYRRERTIVSDDLLRFAVEGARLGTWRWNLVTTPPSILNARRNCSAWRRGRPWIARCRSA